MNERPLVPLRRIPLARAFRTTITERIGVRLGEARLRGALVDLGPSENPEFAFPQETKRVCPEMLVEVLKVRGL